MKKKFSLLLLVSLVATLSCPIIALANSHIHMYNEHVKDGTYYQVQVGSHSHVYAYKPDGTAIYKLCMLIEKRENCRLRCSCGDTMACDLAHTVYTFHQWAY